MTPRSGGVTDDDPRINPATWVIEDLRKVTGFTSEGIAIRVLEKIDALDLPDEVREAAQALVNWADPANPDTAMAGATDLLDMVMIPKAVIDHLGEALEGSP